MAKTKIEWADAVWNPLRYKRKSDGKEGWWCSHVSEGCKNCYAEGVNNRFGHKVPYKAQHADQVEPYLVDEKGLYAPLTRRIPTLYFVNSMTDLFHETVPDAMVDKIMAIIALAPHHRFMVLTKRPERMKAYFEQVAAGKRCIAGNVRLILDPENLGSKSAYMQESEILSLTKGAPLPNLALGVSVEDQETANARIPGLLTTPASIRFVSYEPALGPVDFTRLRPQNFTWLDCLSGHAHAGPGTWGGENTLDLIIVGGESGPGARPMDADWARTTRDQCKVARVPFFFKQMSKKGPIPDDLLVREMPRSLSFEGNA